MSLVLHEPRKDPGSCDHRDAESVGSERDAEFLECLSCGSVLVAQGGHLWVIRRSAGGTENQDFSF